MEINRWLSKETGALTGMPKYARPAESLLTRRLKLQAIRNVGGDQQKVLSLTEILSGIG